MNDLFSTFLLFLFFGFSFETGRILAKQILTGGRK